jgi:hypothetical protein
MTKAPNRANDAGAFKGNETPRESTETASFYGNHFSTEELFHIALVAHKKAPVHDLKTAPWPKLAEALTRHKVGEKDGRGWMPARIERGPRTADRVAELSLLVLDVEADCERLPGGSKRVVGPLPPTLAEMAAELRRRRIAAILATSHSHREPTPDGGTLGPRYRVVILPSRPITPSELKPLGLHVAAVLGIGDAVDQGCIEPARLFYWPRCPEERLPLAEREVVEGEPLDVDAMLQAARAAEAPPPVRTEGTEQNVIGAFNAAHDIAAILERHGYIPDGRNRWRWAQSTTGEAGVVKLPKSERVYSHHPRDPLHGEHGHDAFSAWCTLEHGGDVRKAVREAARILGLEARAPERTPAPKGSAAWPELDLLPEVVEEAPQAFPFDALGPILGPAARAIAESVQAPDSLAAGSVLASAALCAQPFADVVLPHGQTATISLYIITSASSGDRKSATDAVAGRAVEEKRRQDYRRHAAARGAHAEASTGAKSEGQLPAPQSIVVSNGTVEGLQVVLRGQSHIGLFSPEGAELFGGHSMQPERKAAGLAWLCKGWGGETLDSLRVKDGLHVLVGRRVSLHVLLQPVVARKLLADPLAQGQGLIARCLLAEPRSLAGTRLFQDDAAPAHERPEVQRYEERLRCLLNTDPNVQPGGDGFELAPRRLEMDPEARALWVEFYDECEREQLPGGELAGVRAWASKAAEQAARIAGVQTLTLDPDARTITGETMSGAVELATFYLGEHVRLMGQSVAHQQAQRLQDLLAFMRERKPMVEHAEVLQRVVRPLRDLKAEGLNPLLEELERRGYIRRCGKVWEVRP